MKIIQRFKDTMHMVMFVKNNQNYTIMQFIQKSNGERYNYTGDSSPSSYDDKINIICLFKVYRKSLPSFVKRFFYYWNLYK